MNQYVIVLGICITLIWTAYQDISNRAIRLDTLICLMALILIYNRLVLGSILFIDQLFNALFLLVVGFTVLFYIRFRFGTFGHWRNVVGFGDILFAVIIAFGFCMQQFLVWFNLGLVLTLLTHFVFGKVSNKYDSSLVPLAGFQAITLVPFYAFQQLCHH